MALKMDLLPNSKSEEIVTKQLINNIKGKGNKLGTGFLGTAIIMPTLSKTGNTATTYKLLLQNSDPSWLYSVECDCSNP